MSLIIQTTSAVTIAVTISLLIAWRFSLLLILLQPVVIFAIYLRFIILKKISKKSFNSQLHAAKLAVEAIHNFRTVKSFSSQTHILKLFHSADQISRRQTVRLSFLAGACLGTSQCITIFNAAFSLAYGGFLVSRHNITSKQFFQTVPVIISTGRLIAETAALTSDISKGANAISSIFSILNRSSLINPENPEGLSAKNLNGRIDLVNITMAYPSRPDIPILKRFSLSIEPGHSTALVGASGSGKSTIISLIERFYDPLQGTILIDGEDIKSYEIRSLRRRISLVGQEPVLFAGTIEDNIAYGIEEEGRRGGAEIEAAARAANAHDFICGLPEGYQTMCGGRGVKLSGGQKQRIAIARAVMRDPKILLMDEATSALDVRAEMAVQEALERVMVGRTTVVVAHRLSAVKNCDVIAVVDKGVLVEKGTHDTLMKKGGKYYGLFGVQNGVKNVKVS